MSKIDGDIAPLTVAIDGPSGSGKSTQSRRLAQTLGFDYLDTGAMYRALAWAGLAKGLHLEDEQAVVELCETVPLLVSTDPSHQRVEVFGEDITDEIRADRISLQVSHVAVNSGVRQRLVAQQQELIAQARKAGRGIVVEGRDITTVVAPDAEVRILLTADPQERVLRRATENADGGAVDDEALRATAEHVVARDEKDSAAADFMTAADGVMVFDSSHSAPEDTAQVLLAMVATQGKS